ncbi:hypothetical protein PPYR_15460, partial [Photinus pyralis]
ANRLSLDGAPNYKEAVRRIMSAVMTDQLAVFYSYKGHKGKRKFHEKYLSSIVINAVQVCHSKTSENMLLKKYIESEIALWLSKATERSKKHLKN